MGGIQQQYAGAFLLNLYPHIPEDFQENPHIRDIRYILHPAHPIHQKGGGEDGHGGVFGAADGDAALQGSAANNFIFCQGGSTP